MANIHNARRPIFIDNILDMSTQDHSSDVASATNNIEPPFNDESIKKTMKVCRAPRKFRDRIIEDVVSEVYSINLS